MEKGIPKAYKEFSRDNGSISCVDYGNDFVGLCVSKGIKLYTLNMCGLLHVSYILIKRKKKESSGTFFWSMIFTLLQSKKKIGRGNLKCSLQL